MLLGSGDDRFLVCLVVGIERLLPIAEKGPLGLGGGSCVDDILYFIIQNYMIRNKKNRIEVMSCVFFKILCVCQMSPV